MFTDGDRCLPDGSQGIQYCQPSKSCKNGWKVRKIEQTWVGNTALDLKQPMNYPIPRSYWIPSVQSATIRYPSVSIVGIGGGPDAFLVTDNKVSIGNPMSSVPGPNVQIESYRYQLPSVTECPRLTYNLYIFGKHYLNGIDNVQNFGISKCRKISKLPKPIPHRKWNFGRYWNW